MRQETDADDPNHHHRFFCQLAVFCNASDGGTFAAGEKILGKKDGAAVGDGGYFPFFGLLFQFSVSVKAIT